MPENTASPEASEAVRAEPDNEERALLSHARQAMAHQGRQAHKTAMRAEQAPLVLALLAGLLWGGLLTWLGIHTTGDSVVYLHTAVSVSGSGTLPDNPLWPPLYPILLGLLTLATGLPTVAAAVLSACALAVLLAATGRIVQWATQSTVLSAVAMLFLCGWWEVLFIFRVAWSEHLFAALLALHLLLVIRHRERGRISDLALAALSASLVALCRYIGYSLVAVFLLYALIWVVRRRAWRGLGALTLGLAPVAAWLLRNRIVSGTLHGTRSPTERTVVDNLLLAGEVLSGQIWQTPTLTALLVSAAVGGLLVLWRGAGEVRRMLLYTAAWLVCYLAMLLAATSTVRMDLISARFLSPILPTLLAMCALAFGALSANSPSSRRLLNGVLCAVLLAGTLGGGGAWLEGMSGLLRGVHARASHEQVGFSASQTAVELRALLVGLLGERERLDVLLLTSGSNGNKARVLLLRRGLLSGEGLSGARVREIVGRRMTVDVSLDGEPREVVAYSPGRFEEASQVQHALREVQRGIGDTELLVVAQRKPLREAGVADLAGLESGCRAEDDIAPFLIFRCRPASVRR
jgi:hypothetical protein